MRIIALLLLVSLFGVEGYCQKKCGVEVTPQQVALERSRAASQPPTISNAVPGYCLNKTLSLTFWIVNDKNGQPNVSNADLTATVSNLNNYFAPICLSFDICAVNYIDDWNYDILYMPDEDGQLYALYHTAKTINVYLTQILIKGPNDTVCGLGALPPGRDAIWMSKTCLTGNTFPHEMGHFFGLYHTFETDFGNELANGSNCATTGDLICDTPADPQGEASSDCELDPYTQDANGDWYVPDIGNIMSYYSDGCTCGFTVGQYDRMCQKYLSFRFYLW